jgi:hypothetical protein
MQLIKIRLAVLLAHTASPSITIERTRTGLAYSSAGSGRPRMTSQYATTRGRKSKLNWLLIADGKGQLTGPSLSSESIIAQVCGPTTPSTAMARCCCSVLTAASVRVP